MVNSYAMILPHRAAFGLVKWYCSCLGPLRHRQAKEERPQEEEAANARARGGDEDGLQPSLVALISHQVRFASAGHDDDHDDERTFEGANS